MVWAIFGSSTLRSSISTINPVSVISFLRFELILKGVGEPEFYLFFAVAAFFSSQNRAAWLFVGFAASFARLVQFVFVHRAAVARVGIVFQRQPLLRRLSSLLRYSRSSIRSR